MPVYAYKVIRSRAPHRSGTVHHRICPQHQTAQAFQVTKSAFYPMEAKTGEMVSS
jgi:hypothetical protein